MSLDLTKGLISRLCFSSYAFKLDDTNDKDLSVLIFVCNCTQLASSCSSGIGIDKMWPILPISFTATFHRNFVLCRKVDCSLRNRSSATIHVGITIPWSTVPIVSIPPRDNGSCFSRRASFSAVAPHCLLNLCKCCKGSVYLW